MNREKSKTKTLSSIECKCKANGNGGRCLCVAYETLRASQEEFFKNQTVGEEETSVREDGEKEIETGKANLVELIEGKGGEGEAVEVFSEKRRRDAPEPGSGRVMSLVKAFENKLTLPKSNDDVEKEEEVKEDGDGDGKKRESKWEFTSDLLLTAENLGLGSRVSSSLDSNRGRFVSC